MPASSSIRRAPPRTFKMIKRPKTKDASLLLIKERRKKPETITNHHSYYANIVSSMRAEPDHSTHQASGENKISHDLVKEGEIIYRECRKNHAARIGGYIVDGCTEFLAAGEEGTNAALRCASCCCHRSFHKKLEKETNQVCNSSSISDSTSTASQA